MFFTPIITLASSTPTDLLAYAGTLFTDLWLIIAVAVGIPLAFYVIKKAISLIPKRQYSELAINGGAFFYHKKNSAATRFEISMLSIITLPTNFITGSSSITDYVGQIFSDFSGLIAMIVGILLGLLVLEIVIGIIHRK